MSFFIGRAVLTGSRVILRVGSLLTPTLVFLLFVSRAVAQDGDVLTLADAVRIARDDQPQLLALASQERAALESARAEQELPDPKLAFGVENLPVTGDDAFRLGREDMTMLTVGVMQDVVTPSKRRAASARMTADAARIAAERSLFERTIFRDVALAWVDVFEAQRRAATLRKLAAELTAERGVGAGQLSTGLGSVSAVLALDAELSALRDELIVSERDEARARATLSRWIGEQGLRPLPSDLPHELNAHAGAESIASSLDLHPALASAEHAIAAALSDVDRARAERRPDWSWQLMYGQRQDDLSDMVTFQVIVGLPLNRADRQDRRISASLAEADAMRSTLSDRRRLLESELFAVRADLGASAARLDEHERVRIPTARSRLDTARAAYAGGKGSLLEVWQARRAWLEAELHHDMILAERARALAQLAWLSGNTEVLP